MATAPNNDPIFSRVGDIQQSSLAAATLLGPTANTAQDGTGTIYPVFTADATNGGFLQKLMCQPISTVAATVMRVFISDSGLTVTSGALVSNTSANTHLINEFTMPAVTVSQVQAAPHIELMMNMAIPPGMRICVTFGTSTGASTTGWNVTSVAGKF
jgi:hypothetical protein